MNGGYSFKDNAVRPTTEKFTAPALAAARRRGMKVAYVHNDLRLVADPGNIACEFWTKTKMAEGNAIESWTKARDYVPKYADCVAPREGEPNFPKWMWSGFRDTFLDTRLRGWGIRTLFVVGYSRRAYLLSAYPKVRRETSIPIMGSERLNTKTQFRQLLELDGIDIAQPGLVYAGGITEVKKIAAIADTYHVPISFHNTKGPVGILAAAHLPASIPNEAPMEFVRGLEWRDEILMDPIEIRDGCLLVPDRPGLGVELNVDEVEKHRWHPGDPF